MANRNYKDQVRRLVKLFLPQQRIKLSANEHMCRGLLFEGGFSKLFQSTESRSQTNCPNELS
jgi:hypothetical protein